ncbi:hypothetical protein WIW72_13175, partial [Stygiolobus sp. CP859M]
HLQVIPPVLTLKKYYHQRSPNKAQTIQIIHFRLTKLLSTLCYVYTKLGVYLILGDRDESTFREVKKYLPEEGRWVSDDYNLYFRLKDHTVVSPVNPNESFHSSLRDRLIRFKRATKAVNRSIRSMMYSIALVLWERRLIPEFVA